MKLEQILPSGWNNPRIWPSATHIFVAHNSIWATDGPPEWYEKTPGWVPTKYSQPIELIPADMPEDARSVVWVRAEAEAEDESNGEFPLVNEDGHNLADYVTTGWDFIVPEHDYIAIDADGEVCSYLDQPTCDGEDPIWLNAYGVKNVTWVRLPDLANWKELIWQRPTPTQC